MRISKTIEEYYKNLTDVKTTLSDANEIKLNKSEYASYLFASTNKGSIEISENEGEVWVEYWMADNDDVDHECTFSNYHDAIADIQRWMF